MMSSWTDVPCDWPHAVTREGFVPLQATSPTTSASKFPTFSCVFLHSLSFGSRNFRLLLCVSGVPYSNCQPCELLASHKITNHAARHQLSPALPLYLSLPLPGPYICQFGRNPVGPIALPSFFFYISCSCRDHECNRPLETFLSQCQSRFSACNQSARATTVHGSHESEFKWPDFTWPWRAVQ